MKFRMEINALRAFSVLAVFLYHIKMPSTQLPLLSGGFLGVDVFFVISGYLISQVINDEILSRGKFDFGRFYLKRYRRIIPAFLVMLVLVTIISTQIFNLSDRVTLLESGLASLLFISNIYFWLAGVAYAANDGLDIFLHTWSLSVEEQFYIGLPAFLLLTSYTGKRIWLFLACFICSIALAEYLSGVSFNFNFLNPASRLWEFLGGTAIALYREDLVRFFRLSAKNKELLVTVCLIFLIFSVFYYDDTFSHPGLVTVPVILAVVFIILLYDGEHFSFLPRFVNTSFIQFTGNISYSLYLWHYPVLIWSTLYPSYNVVYNNLMALVISYVFGYLSYRFIENTFRNSRLLSNRTVAVFSLVTILSFAGIAHWYYPFGYDYNEFEIDASSDPLYLLDQNSYVKAWHKHRLDAARTLRIDSEKTKALIVGNSHATDFYNLVESSKHSKTIEFSVTQPPVAFNNDVNYRISCFLDYLQFKSTVCNEADFNDPVDALDQAYRESDVIFLASAYIPEDFIILERIITLLHQDGKQVYLVSNANEFLSNRVIDIPVKNFVKANKRFPNTGELLDIEKETYRLFMLNTEVTDMNEKLLKIANDNEIVFIDRTKIGCSVTKEVCAVLTTSGALINYDYGHLSVLGAKWLGEHDQSINSWNFFL